ncbi:MAG: glycosyltransferase, partial [Acidimicrobiales bacterium]
DAEEGSSRAKAALLADAGWDDDGSLLLGVVSRLVDQKGIDFITGLVPYLATIPARLVLLGSGLPHIVDDVRTAADRHPDRVWAITDRFDEPLAHRIFAGSDLFLMPSRFEPCGLAQMQALAYGTPTVATSVGGLVDTIVDIDIDRDNGTGTLTRTNDLAGFVDAVHRAARAYRLASRRKAMRRRAMNTDWSWHGPAQKHLALYEALLAR